jgi:hypothetical protein
VHAPHAVVTAAGEPERAVHVEEAVDAKFVEGADRLTPSACSEVLIVGRTRPKKGLIR